MSNTHKRSSAMITTIAVLIGSFFAFAAIEAQAQVMSLAPPKRNGNKVRISRSSASDRSSVQFRDRSMAPGKRRTPGRTARSGRTGQENRAAGSGAMSVAPPRRTLSRIGGKHFARVGNNSVTTRARGSGENSSSFRMDRVGAGSARVD